MDTPQPSDPPRADDANVSKRRPRLGRWFTVVFFVVFIWMAVAGTAMYMHPSGQAVVRCAVWEYYLEELPRVFKSPRNLGPTSGHVAAAVTLLLEHVALSVAGGFLLMGVAWVASRRQRQANDRA